MISLCPDPPLLLEGMPGCLSFPSNSAWSVLRPESSSYSNKVYQSVGMFSLRTSSVEEFFFRCFAGARGLLLWATIKPSLSISHLKCDFCVAWRILSIVLSRDSLKGVSSVGILDFLACSTILIRTIVQWPLHISRSLVYVPSPIKMLHGKPSWLFSVKGWGMSYVPLQIKNWLSPSPRKMKLVIKGTVV